jgi:hypothetical protein
VEVKTWGGGAGTFWQLGEVIGMVWIAPPKWQENVRSSHWRLGSPEVARHYFDAMAESFRDHGQADREP